LTDIPPHNSQQAPCLYAARFFAARNFAQRKRVAAAILFLPAAEILCLCLTGAEAVVFAEPADGCGPFLTAAHLAFCAAAIFRREAAEIIRFSWFVPV
jgi:hypothetical protein